MAENEEISSLWAEDFREELITSRCRLTRDFANEGLEELKFFAKTLEDFIVEEEKKEISELDQDAQKVPEDAKGEFWSYHYPYWWKDIFASRLRASLVILLISAVEEHVNEVFRDARRVLRSTISDDKARQNTIERGRKYLKDHCHFQRPKPRLWELIRYLCDIRNILAHNGGRLEGSRQEKRVRTFMSQEPELLKLSYGVLDIEPEFCEFAFSKTEEFFSELQKELIELCERNERPKNKTQLST